ncbi:MAG: tRNA (adenosine(37)-N6)-threonylcarbamoyltransferase complex ATPase subunit type 1 TsaE [Chloroflexota bacterium]
MEIVSGSEGETEALGIRLAADLTAGDMVLLTGEIGAGKSVLIRGMATGLGGAAWRGSPTFNLIHEYDTEPPLVHIDLYRLAPAEVEGLGLEEYTERSGCVLAIEWADRASVYLRSLASGRVIDVSIAYDSDRERTIAWSIASPAGQRLP